MSGVSEPEFPRFNPGPNETMSDYTLIDGRVWRNVSKLRAPMQSMSPPRFEQLSLRRRRHRRYEPDFAVDRGRPYLPPSARVAMDTRVQQFWVTRVCQSVDDVYAGAPLCKLPEDLRVYEHLMWASSPRVVVEVGAFGGGSSLWFRDRLRALALYGRVIDPFVISVELESGRTVKNLDAADPTWRDSIHLLEADITAVSSIQRITKLVPPGTSTLVIEDSSHGYETTWASLEGLSGLVQPRGFFVVEDTCVDVPDLRAQDDWPKGAAAALRDWLETESGQCFNVRRDLELYGLTSNPGGYLERVR